MNWGIIGAAIGSFVGIGGGIVGIYFGIKNTTNINEKNAVSSYKSENTINLFQFLFQFFF